MNLRLHQTNIISKFNNNYCQFKDEELKFYVKRLLGDFSDFCGK